MPLQGRVLYYLERKEKKIPISSSSTVRVEKFTKTAEHLSTISHLLYQARKMKSFVHSTGTKHVQPMPLTTVTTSRLYCSSIYTHTICIRMPWHYLEHQYSSHYLPSVSFKCIYFNKNHHGTELFSVLFSIFLPPFSNLAAILRLFKWANAPLFFFII